MKKTAVIVIMVLFFGFTVLNWISPSAEYSDSERRYLKLFPELTGETLLNGTFMDQFEDYSLDQFPLRDTFRGLKRAVATYLFGQKEVNDLYVYEDYIVSMEYPLSEDSLDWAAGRFTNVYEKFFKDTDAKVYYSIIPDKNYFLAEESKHLSLDYEALVEHMQKQLGYMTYIDIFPSLTIEDYYRTDTHWDQSKLLETAKVLAEGMGISLEEAYETVLLEAPFPGVYHGQLALPIQPDALSYLDSDLFDDCVVYDHQNGKEMSVYEMEKVTGKDPYEMFLGGPLSLITIENPNATTDKELILFRDSFGSSIAPLLAEGYSTITLVDIRYIQPAILEKYVVIEDQDVLFLYSTSVLNNSSTIK